MPCAEPTTDIAVALTSGDLTLTGRLIESSNHALLGSVTHAGVTVDCVYKPVRGERPLWDFPDGTLAARERAAYLVAEEAGWRCVPPTVLRDGPAGQGMVQQWIHDVVPDSAVRIFPEDAVPDGWCAVLALLDADERPLVLAHADSDALRLLAGFDLVINNADRKASHILPIEGGRALGVDHGVTMHADPKLRTILWGWAGQPLPGAVMTGLERLQRAARSGMRELLMGLVTETEWEALLTRVSELIDEPIFPYPPEERTPIPWPPL